MIPSAKNRVFSRWFERRVHRRVREEFGALYLAGRQHLAQALAQGPVLVVSNHSAWWDPLLVLVLTERMIPADGYAMMDADNLRRLPFFAKVGGFGVDRSSRRDGAQAVRYAASLLDRPGRLVWIFAQGQERPLHERPLRFLGGAAQLARRLPAVTVLPVALSYAFGSAAAPFIHVAVGSPLPAARSLAQARRAQAEAVEAELARVERELSEPGSQGFVAHALERPRRLERLAERMLAGLARPFVPGLAAAPDPAPRALPPGGPPAG